MNPEATLSDYLNNVSLVSAQDDIKEGEHITLMTAHTAKGLEFPVVFVVRFNQDIFPNFRATLEGGFKALEEERRLAYVAMTRAKERLYLTYCFGYSYVSHSDLSESQFLKESGNQPKSSYSFNNGYRKNSNNGYQSKYSFDQYKNKQGMDLDKEPIDDFSQITNDVTHWEIGDICIHKKFGRGVVLAVEDDSIIKVDFDEHGEKQILGNHPLVSKGSK